MAILFCSDPAAASRWRGELIPVLPGRDIRFWPEIGDPSEVEYAIVWHPERGLLASLPNLKLILSLGAGVDHILADPDWPRRVPIVRLVDPHMTDAMSEYVALQVLRLHRQDLDYQAQQRQRVWHERAQKNAAERRVGILGFGALGRAAAATLKALGFDVAAWSRREQAGSGVATYAGSGGFAAILGRSEILVCLLPLTPETEGILNATAFAQLPSGAALVNAGRGGHLVEADLLAALDSGQLSAAVLDVFREEPLPPSHPFWHHPRIIVTPHAAAATHAPTAAAILCDSIRRFEQGLPVPNLIDPVSGY
ncbi:MAG: glyoxylate/hydroxypyruvate reductase A [Alphaproteobacteria bacterium]|nr:glyoxylate/hydroxypyruvate reductase A [Alphaproteobacteria bacterium]